MPKGRKSKTYSGVWPQERERRIATQFEQLLVEGHRCYSVASSISESRVDCVKRQSNAMLRQIQSECEDSCCRPLQEDDVELMWYQVQHHAYERPRMLAADCADGHKPTAKKRPHPPLPTANKRPQNQQLMPKHSHVAMSIRTINEASSSSFLAGADIPIDELSPLEEFVEELMETD